MPASGQKVKVKIMSSVYFGGSRSLPLTPGNLSLVSAVVSSVINSGKALHVGCQLGADQAVISCALRVSCFLHVFAVAPFEQLPAHVRSCIHTSASVTVSAGGQSAPMPARYLLRSIAAFQGCSSAVFFSPGAGSLAVAREALKAGLSVFAFQQAQPARVPSSTGAWVASSFMGFACWQWQAPAQLTLF